nr:PREDICTED: C-X-C motif chemokine 6-like isoform X2 [Latimeria chalumnae]|eukprot:XP_006003781.1 PREDICTED: C-X-C motif chemokine 6-like isoform X2 [Latimeria chalumnae]
MRNAGNRKLAVPGISIVGASQRCLCKQELNNVRTRLIQTWREYPQSPTCDKIEVVVRLQSGRTICLNPNSPFVKKVKKLLRQMKNKKS